MESKHSDTRAISGFLWPVSAKRLKNKAFPMQRRKVLWRAAMLGSKRQVGGVGGGIVSCIARNKPRRSHKTIVNEFKSPEKPILTSILLTGYFAMMKRILFVMLTAFVISLPVTGILTLSFDSDSYWQEPARERHTQPAPKAAYLDGMNQYLRSLRFLIDDHHSFGPFT